MKSKFLVKEVQVIGPDFGDKQIRLTLESGDKNLHNFCFYLAEAMEACNEVILDAKILLPDDRLTKRQYLL